jgi:uncharacterized membrane protein
VADSGNSTRLDQLTASERSGNWGRRFRLREWLGRSLLVVPSLYIVFALVLADVLLRVEGDEDLLSLNLAPGTATSILSAVATGMIAFTGLVVSVAVVVVQFGASQYTPRLVGLFRRDPVVKHSLGIFIAPAVYALVSQRDIGRDGSDVVPSLTVGLSLVLVVVALVAFFVLISRLLDLLHPRHVISHMVDAARRAIRSIYPFALEGAPRALDVPDVPVTAVVANKGRGGVLSALDRARIVRAATAADVVVELGIGVGGYVPHGAPLFSVRGPASGLDETELRRAAIIADERTITQDPAFAIRAIVDIALRALSPAVNDPTTAVQVLDGLEVMLQELASRKLERGQITDEGGTLRLVYPNPSWADLLDLALTEIRRYGADSPQVARRMRALLIALLEFTPEVRRPAIEQHLVRLDKAVEAAYSDPVERAHALTADHLGIGSVEPATP